MQTDTGCAKLCLTDWKIQATLPVSLRYATGYFMISHGLLWLTLQTLTAGETAGVQSSANVTLTNRVRRNIQTSIIHTSLTLSTKEFKPQLHCLRLEATGCNLTSLWSHFLSSTTSGWPFLWVVLSYLLWVIIALLSILFVWYVCDNNSSARNLYHILYRWLCKIAVYARYTMFWAFIVRFAELTVNSNYIDLKVIPLHTILEFQTVSRPNTFHEFTLTWFGLRSFYR